MGNNSVLNLRLVLEIKSVVDRIVVDRMRCALLQMDNSCVQSLPCHFNSLVLHLQIIQRLQYQQLCLHQLPQPLLPTLPLLSMQLITALPQVQPVTSSLGTVAGGSLVFLSLDSEFNFWNDRTSKV